MKMLLSSLALAALLGGSASAAPKSTPKSQVPRTAVLMQGLKAMVAPLMAPVVQAAPGVDRDQGDEHASPRAIMVVCSKNTPAAQRSAICNGEPVTPD